MSEVRQEIPLTEAAHLIRMDYHKLRSSVIRGECAGRLVYGRWIVDREGALRLRDLVAAAGR
jgi:hypothetical protein